MQFTKASAELLNSIAGANQNVPGVSRPERRAPSPHYSKSPHSPAGLVADNRAEAYAHTLSSAPPWQRMLATDTVAKTFAGRFAQAPTTLPAAMQAEAAAQARAKQKKHKKQRCASAAKPQ